MTRKEIVVYRHRLHNILNKKDDDQRLEELKQLAKEVGAGYVHTEIAAATTTTTTRGSEISHETTTHRNPISESELVVNINNALQTETMIDMCKTAARNYLITIVAAIAAFLSALAAWTAIVKPEEFFTKTSLSTTQQDESKKSTAIIEPPKKTKDQHADASKTDSAGPKDANNIKK